MIVERFKRMLEVRQLASEAAARAAPYCHPRMGYVTERPEEGEVIPLAERLKVYERRDALKAAGSNVVELKPQGDQSADPSGSGPIPPPIS